jgi:hypothetical protein
MLASPMNDMLIFDVTTIYTATTAYHASLHNMCIGYTEQINMYTEKEWLFERERYW